MPARLARRSRWVAVATTVLLGVVASIPARAAAPTTGRDDRPVHPVGVRTETFVDATRPTPAVPALDIAAAPSRTLKVTIWYPAAGARTTATVPDAAPARDARYPLIVWAPGNGALGSNAPALIRGWASLGYVVAAPDFPVSSRARSNLDAIDDWSAQPGDVRVVIDRVLALDRTRGGLGRIVDKRHIGVAGHSLGAITALALAYGQSDRDRRVDAVVSFAGISLLDGTDVSTQPTPLLLVHGTNDATIPFAQSQTMFDKARGPHYLVTVVGGGHSTYLQAPDPDTTTALTTATVAFWDRYLRGDRAAGRRISPALDVPGVVTVQASAT